MKRVTLKKREMSYAMTEELNTLRTNIQFSGVDKKSDSDDKQFLRRRKVYDYLSAGKISCGTWETRSFN